MKVTVQSPGRALFPGFTLVEIMVAMVLIGMVAALSIPAFQRVHRDSQNGRLVNDLRVFAQPFEIYNSTNGAWSDGAMPGVVPSAPVAMTGDFKSAAWEASTVVGGYWRWERDTADFVVAITIFNITCSDVQLTEIDARLDDGNLNTGPFQKLAARRIGYCMEQ